AGSDEWTLQAPSPDEAALVKYARECGIKLIRRDDDSIILECLNITGRPQLRYDIIECFPFSSDRKRMGIIVKEEISGQYVYLIKGADSVMIPRVAGHDSNNAFMEDVVDDYARHGKDK
ncbi:ATP synthase subunit 9, partial [Perkinsus olseni]